MLNSAQHARSAASRLDDVIDRSALEQAREGFRRPGYRGVAHWTRSPKSTLEVRAVRHHAIINDIKNILNSKF